MPRLLPALLAVALAACGGGLEPMPRRADAVAIPLVLASEPREPGRLADAAQARARYEAALAEDPTALAALNDLALAWLADGRPDAARPLLDEVVAKGAPSDQQLALLNLAAIHAQEGNLPAALAYAEAAGDVDPSRPEPGYALALLAAARGDRALALSRAGEAAAADPAAEARAALLLAPEARASLDALVREAARTP